MGLTVDRNKPNPNVWKERASEVISLLESGALDELSAAVWHRMPGIDYLRDEVASHDYRRLLEVAKASCWDGPTNAVSQLAISVLYPHRHQREVKEFLKWLWSSGDIRAKFSALWRLLDDETLPVSHQDSKTPSHESCFKFVKEHWIEFLDTQWSFMGHGQGAKVLDNAKARLADRRFPKSKAWAYLCGAIASPDRDAVKDLITKYVTDDAFVASKKDELLELAEPWQPTAKFADLDDRILRLVKRRPTPQAGALGAAAALRRARRLGDAKEMLQALVESFPPGEDVDTFWRDECGAMHQHFQSLFWTTLQSVKYPDDLRTRERLDHALAWSTRFAAMVWLIERPKPEEDRKEDRVQSYPALYSLSRRMEASEQLDLFTEYQSDGNEERSFPTPLVEGLRVVQWQVGVHNLPEERFRRRVVYTPSVHPKTAVYNREALTDLMKEGWRTVSCGWGPFARRRDGVATACSPVPDGSTLSRFLDGFDGLLEQIADDPTAVSDSHRKLRDNFSLADNRNPMLLADGELTFFCLLWVLRYAHSRNGVALKGWLKGESESALLNYCFKPKGESWSLASHERFVTTLGILGPYADNGWVMTPRWWSLQRWLLKQHVKVRNELSGHDRKDRREEYLYRLAEMLPISRIAPSQLPDDVDREGYIALADALVYFFLEDVPFILRRNAKNLIVQDPSQFIQQCFGDLMPETPGSHSRFFQLLEAGFKHNGKAQHLEDGLHDRILTHLCRSPGLPVEYMFRANQPYELHVLILPQHYRRQEVESRTLYAPAYITFASIVGSVPDEVQHSTSDSRSTKVYKDWMGSYILPLTAMADEVASPVLAEATTRSAWHAFENRLGHDASKAIGLLRGERSAVALGAIRTFLHSSFFASAPEQLAANIQPNQEATDDYFDNFIMSAKNARIVRSIVEAACSVARSVHTLRKIAKDVPLADLTIDGLKYQQAKQTPDVEFDESLSESCADWDMNQRLRLFAVMVIAMVNTYFHASAFASIRIGTESRNIVIANKPEKKPLRSEKVWGTSESLRLLVSQPEYGRLANEVVMGLLDREQLWITKIPMPATKEVCHDA